MRVEARQIAAVVPGGDLLGNEEALVTTVAPLHAAGPGSLSWLKTGHEMPIDWSGAVLIIGQHEIFRVGEGQAVIICPNPRLGLGFALKHFFASRTYAPTIAIDPSAWVDPSAVVGREGQAYEWHEDRWFEIPHVAGVAIGEDVKIGPMTTIMRGLLEDTVIGAGCRIGAHCNVGHGAMLGRHCVLAPYAAVGGSCRIGNRVTIWSGAIIRNGVTVGDGATIGQMANVLCDVPDGETWIGNPARPRD